MWLVAVGQVVEIMANALDALVQGEIMQVCAVGMHACFHSTCLF